jgi:hypothetical protein
MIFMFKNAIKKTLPLALVLAALALHGCDGGDPNPTQTGDPPASQPSDTTLGTGDPTNTAGTQSPQNPTDTQGTPDPQGKPGFPFVAFGLEIYVGDPAAPILAALPEPSDTFEAPSCAFEGIDITYFYPSFELTTYPYNDVEYVLSVALIDDNISTPNGVYIGGVLADMEKAYGTAYEKDGDTYTYLNGSGSLVFAYRDGYIARITYAMVFD